METDGYHMKACCAEVPGVMHIVRDALGNVTSMKGISAEMLNWMARALKLTYECENRIPITTVENTSSTIGAMHFATHDVCDVIAGPVVLRYERFKELDFIHPSQTESVLLLMPMPIFVGNSLAFVEPFYFSVWISIISSVIVMILALMLVDCFKEPPGTNRPKLDLHWLFVIGTLFGRAGFWTPNKIRIRILMAIWLLGTVILSGFYTTKLFGYLVISIPEPVVNSVEELADKTNVDLVVFKGWAPDLTISNSENLVMKKLVKKLEKNPGTSRCSRIPDCFKQVKTNKRPTVLINQVGSTLTEMMNDFRQTGECNFALSQKSFDNYYESWMTRKGDRNTESYNKAMMRMREAGLINHWQDIYQPKPQKCFEMAKPIKENNPRVTPKLNFMNMAMPFGMLLVGCCLSSIVLLCEKLLAAHHGLKSFRADAAVSQ